MKLFKLVDFVCVFLNYPENTLQLLKFSTKLVINLTVKVESTLKHGGLVRDLNPGPLAPKARIIPLDQLAIW